MSQLLEAERLEQPRTQKPRATPAQLHADARKRLNKGDYKAALELFNEAARAAKKNAEHLLGAAGALRKLKRPLEAIRVFERAMTLQSLNPTQRAQAQAGLEGARSEAGLEEESTPQLSQTQLALRQLAEVTKSARERAAAAGRATTSLDDGFPLRSTRRDALESLAEAAAQARARAAGRPLVDQGPTQAEVERERTRAALEELDLVARERRLAARSRGQLEEAAWREFRSGRKQVGRRRCANCHVSLPASLSVCTACKAAVVGRPSGQQAGGGGGARLVWRKGPLGHCYKQAIR